MENNSVREEKEMEIDLVSLFFYLIGKWKILLWGGIIGGILAGAIVFFQTPMYESNSTLYVLSKTTSITSMADLQLGTELTSDFTVIATSKPVIDGAIDELKSKKKIKMTREEIQKMLTVANKTDTRMLSITVTSDDAELSCAAVSQMASITQTDPPTIVERPEVADKPVDNGLVKKAALGVLLGIVLLGIILTVRYMMNDKIQTEEDIQTYLDATVLGIIPVDKELAYYSKQEEKTEKSRHSHKKKKHS